MSSCEKILPIKYPSITCWPWNTALHAILESRDDTHDWIYSNYIQTFAFTLPHSEGIINRLVFDFFPNMIDYLLCPWIKPQIFGRDYIAEKYRNLKNFFIEALDSGHYVYTVINQEHILHEITGNAPARHCHDLLIYGYNSNLNTFHVADFTFKNKYSFEQVSIDSLLKGFMDVSEAEDYLIAGRGGVVLLGVNEKAAYSFNESLVRKSFEDYYLSNGFDYFVNMMMSNSIKTDAEYVGLSCYDLILDCIRGVRDVPIDWKIPHIIYEHKNLMLKRIEFMKSRGYFAGRPSIIDSFANLRENALLARGYCIKRAVSKDDRITQRILHSYEQMVELERSIIPYVIDSLS